MKKFTKSLALIGLFGLLSASMLTGQAEASWGAARLYQLQQSQNTTTTTYSAPTRYFRSSPTTTPTNPVSPAPTPTPTPTPTPAPAPVPAQPSVQTGLNQEEAIMLKLINDERVKNGLKPLISMAKLNEVARLKSQDIITNKYFAHTSPTYGSFSSMISKAGISYRSAGENLAKARNAEHAFSLLMASSGHRANILNANFTHVGLGILPDQYGVVVTQMFIMQ